MDSSYHLYSRSITFANSGRSRSPSRSAEALNLHAVSIGKQAASTCRLDDGGRFEIEDCNTPDGTYVNGIPIHKQILKAGDQIVLGKTVLEFAIKESR